MLYMILTTLKNTIKNYLKDAGFADDEYLVDDKQKEYVEVFFSSSEAVYYIITDVLKSEYKEIIEIKEYRYGNGNITAIITFL